jgi:acyl carrier protein
MGNIVMDVMLLNEIAEAIRSTSKRTRTMAITAESRLVEDLALDSLDLVSVLMKLEDRFDIKIELDDVPNIETVSELAAHLEKIRGPQASAA